MRKEPKLPKERPAEFEVAAVLGLLLGSQFNAVFLKESMTPVTQPYTAKVVTVPGFSRRLRKIQHSLAAENPGPSGSVSTGTLRGTYTYVHAEVSFVSNTGEVTEPRVLQQCSCATFYRAIHHCIMLKKWSYFCVTIKPFPGRVFFASSAVHHCNAPSTYHYAPQHVTCRRLMVLIASVSTAGQGLCHHRRRRQACSSKTVQTSACNLEFHFWILIARLAKPACSRDVVDGFLDLNKFVVLVMS